MNRKNLTILIFAIIVLLGTIFFVQQEKKKVAQEQEKQRQVGVQKDEERKVADEKARVEKEAEQEKVEEEKKQESADLDLDKLEWKKYENKEVGFEISYPSNYFLSTSWKAGNENLVVAIRNIRIAKGIEAIKNVPAIESGYVEISAWKNKENLDLFEWFKKNDSRYLEASEEERKDFKINDPNYSDKFKKYSESQKEESDVADIGVRYEIKEDSFNGYKVLRTREPSIMGNESMYFKIKDNIVCFDSQGIPLDQDLQNGEKNHFAEIMATLKITK